MRRVDLSRELRQALIELRNARLVAAELDDQMALANELVFPSPDGSIIDPDNLYPCYLFS